MKLGVCTTLENANLLKKIGYSYIELNIGDIAQKNEQEYKEFKNSVSNSPLKPYAFNCLFPAGYHIIGNNIDISSIKNHLETALYRAKDLGGEIVVFGSGGTRRIPEGFPKEKAIKQTMEFLKILSEIAGKNDITITLEPLRVEETNFINSANEGLKIVKTLNHPNIRLLIDYYHMSCEKEDSNVVFEAGKEFLKHIHIANPEERLYPKKTDSSDYAAFFSKLIQIGYKGGVSIEANTKNIQRDAEDSFPWLSSLMGN